MSLALVTVAEAAERRAAAAGGDAEQHRRAAPNGGERARALPFTADLRATKRERNGQLLYNLVGIASVTDTRYEMWDMFGPYDEIIDRGAFTDTLAADPDVAFLTNHRGVTMARTRSRPGQPQDERTLFLGMTDTGLQSDAWLNPKRQDVSDLVLAIDDGNITEMSFAFMLEEGWWSDDFSTFRISKLDINRGDVSAVNYGANPYTSIAARSREVLADIARLPLGAARAALTQLTERIDVGAEAPAPAPVVPPAIEERSIAALEAALEATVPEVRAATGRSVRHIEALLEI